MATNDYFNFNPGNKDYDTLQNKISEGQQDVTTARQKYEQAQPRVEDAYQAQQQAMKDRQSYSDLLSQAKQSEGVDASKEQYQKDVAAVNAIQDAMNTLPSSINANSNVVLTQAQRQAALGNEMQKYLSSYDYATRQAATSGSLYDRAQNAAFAAAEAGATEQQQNISNAMQAYNNEINNLQNLYSQLANEKQMLHTAYGDLYDEEYRRNMAELEQAAAEKDRELQRYIADQEDATKRWIAEKEDAATRYAADAGMRVQQYLQGLNKQNGTGGNDYLSFLNSEAALNAPGWESDMSDEEKKYWLMRNAQDYQRYMSTGDMQGLRNLTSGDTYQSYLNWRNQ